MRNCYGSFTATFDTLEHWKVIWEPYRADRLVSRYPLIRAGDDPDAAPVYCDLSPMCFRDQAYWFTKANIVFDMCVEQMAVQRVMRQFGWQQTHPPNQVPIAAHIHK